MSRQAIVENAYLKKRPRASLRRRLALTLRRDWQLWALLLPALAFFVVFCYFPMYGVQIAFRDYKAAFGITGSKWVGLKFFEKFFNSYYCGRMFANTFLLNLFGLFFGFPIPILLAIMLNQLNRKRFKGFAQTAIYVPHFISTVVLAGMIYLFFSPTNGIINHLITAAGGKSIYFIMEPGQVMIPVHAEGKQACLPRNMDIIEFGAALTTDNRDIESSLRWLDAQFETENMLVAQNGPVGDTLLKRDDGRYEVSYVPKDNELYQSVPVICGQFFAPAEYYASVYVPAAHRQEKAGYCAMYEEAGVLEEVSCKLLTTVAPKTTEENADLTRLKAKLKSIVDAEIVAMVTQGVTEESRNVYLKKLEEAGIGDYRSIYQQVYDRWQKEK